MGSSYEALPFPANTVEPASVTPEATLSGSENADWCRAGSRHRRTRGMDKSCLLMVQLMVRLMSNKLTSYKSHYFKSGLLE